MGLALWAILPRWQSVAPGALRGLVVAARDAPGVRDLRRVLGGYDRWRALHRTTGLFVAAGFAHGVLDGTPFDDAPVLRWSYVAIGVIGLGFYVYRELLARLFLSLHDYQVDAVRQIGDGLVEAVLRPLGRPMGFVPGQFAMVYLEAKDGWHRHPFTISSAPHEDVVRVTVKALGDTPHASRSSSSPACRRSSVAPTDASTTRVGPTGKSGSPQESASRRSSAGCAPWTSIRHATSTSSIPPRAERRSHRRST